MPEEEILTEEEKQALKEYVEKHKLDSFIEAQGYPKPEDKAGFYELFLKILKTRKTTKASAVNDNELMAFRLLSSGALFCNTLGYDQVEEFLKDEAEIIFSSALSANRKMGAFLQALITQKRELSSIGKAKKKGGLFSKKENE